jgi:TM2 domain-containing membrane protein YozV
MENLANATMSNKGGVITMILALFFGGLGMHRFYVGKTTTGILYLFTLGLCGVGVFVDMFNLISNRFLDSDGKVVNF